jgi:endoglucanase
MQTRIDAAGSTSTLSRRAVLVGGAAAAGAAGLTASSVFRRAGAGERGALPVGGVNLAGADFGKIPGMHGREYLYPPVRHFEYFASLGFGLVRLPFKWERLQPDLNVGFAPREEALLTETVRHAAQNGQQLILDPHNYAKRRLAADAWTAEHGIGSAAVPTAAFADFWMRLAELFKHDEHVIFGLMNEPVGIKVGPWLEAVNLAIAAIRATGATNLILVPGVEYSGAHAWHRRGNTAMAGVIDPLDRFAFDVHQYFDHDSSGTTPDAVSGTIGSERLAMFQAWAREHGFKAVLGEFNGGRNLTAANALHDLCQEMTANPDVWLGWAAWAAGPRWPEDEMFNLEPWRDGRIREQTAILARYAKPQSPDYWVMEGAAVDLDFARGRLHGAQARADVFDGLPKQGAAGDAARQELATGVPLRPRGSLASLMQAPALTLVLDVSDFGGDGSYDILSVQGRALLRRAADGALELAGGSPRTQPRPLRNWQSRRRIAIAIERNGGRVAFGATGIAAMAVEAAAADLRHATIGGPIDGRLRRITGYLRFSDRDALQRLLA